MGPWDAGVAHIANVLQARQIVINMHQTDDEARLMASIGRNGMLGSGSFTNSSQVLPRRLQNLTWDRLRTAWMDSPEAQPFLSQTDGQPSESTVKKYYRTYCDQSYGGDFWLRWLIVFGGAISVGVECNNQVTQQRIHEKAWCSASLSYMFYI